MSKMRILAIDDNTVNLATIEQELKEDYEIIPMLSGRRAVKFLCCDKVDLILLDVEMPVMDGIKTLSEIRKLENGVTVPVIFLTANKDKNTVLEGSKLGIMDYITKPFDSNDLNNRIKHVFERLGSIPISEEELLKNIEIILECFDNDKISGVLSKMDEVINYKISEEISGRVRVAREKLEKGEEADSRAMIQRIVNMLRNKLYPKSELNNVPLSIREIFGQLLLIKSDIKAYKTKDAIKHCQSLLQYSIEDDLKTPLNDTLNKLLKYDDIAASAIVDELISITGRKIAQRD